MPQYYTLEEAANVLQMPPDELRDKAKKKEVRAFQDRGNWRFLAQQIDELARERGIGSDPELQMGDAKKKAGEERLAVDFNLEDDAVPLGKDKDPRSTKSGPKSPSPKSSGVGPRSPKPSSDSDVRLVMDSNLDFQIDSDVKVESSGPKSSGSRKKSKATPDSGSRLVDRPSDSDVKVIPSEDDAVGDKGPKSPSDSDIRLDHADGGKKKGPEAGIITEEIDLDAEEARLAAKSKSGAKPKPLTKHAPQLPTSSPFELSEMDITLDNPPGGKGPKSSGAKPKPKKSATDSSSDFELIPFDDSKAPGELGSGEIPLLSGDEEVGLGDLPAPNAGNSGINLQDPADSGISLEQGGSDEMEFELSLDSGATPKPTSSSKQPAAKKPPAKKPAEKKSEKPAAKQPAVEEDDKDSSSEFELSLDEPSSDDSSSEFELSLDESSSTVGLKPTGESSDSEFELTLDTDSGLAASGEDSKDIFEETNFDVPALDEESGSEAVAIDETDTDLEGSDFEISLDESGTAPNSDSQVVALEGEEDADDAAATIARPRKAKAKSKVAVEAANEDDLDVEDIEASGRKPKTDEEEEEDEDLVAAGSAAPTEWGPLPAILLFPTVLVMFIVGLMGYEMVQGMWGYHKPAKVSKLITDAIARQIDESLPKD